MKKQNAIFKPVEGFKKCRWYRSPLLFLALAVGLGIGSCRTIQYVPVTGETQVEYRDSIITKLDTIKIEITNTEYIRDWTGLLDTLELKTTDGLVTSRSWCDTTKSILAGELKTEPRQVDVAVPHTLEYHQKDSVKIQQVPYPVGVTKEIKVYPRWMVILSILGIILTGVGLFQLYLKFKKKFKI